jgi:hypothetical protein
MMSFVSHIGNRVFSASIFLYLLCIPCEVYSFQLPVSTKRHSSIDAATCLNKDSTTQLNSWSLQDAATAFIFSGSTWYIEYNPTGRRIVYDE